MCCAERLSRRHLATAVVFRALRATDGSFRASRLTVGVDGARLPM
jgi:hypothetical protein